MSCPLCGDVCRCDPDLRPETSCDAQSSQAACAAGGDAYLSLQNRSSAALREEIAARVNRYRSRRTYRGPRYPTLRLKFEPEDATPPRVEAAALASSDVKVRQSSVAENTVTEARSVRVARVPDSPRPTPELLNAQKVRENIARELAAKVIEFPRANMVPVPLDELAERVIDRPRILDVPEPAPPPPALGGILISAAEEPEPEPRPGIDVPLQSAALDQRLLASAVDACLVLVASAVFGYLWFRITRIQPSLTLGLAAMAAIAAFFWAAYQYLFLVYTGTTPGLRLAKLQLSRFDGSPPSRVLRRWRVVVSFLSVASLGMGFFWCFLDEDALCWHDRITRTYLAPKVPPENKI